MSEKPVSVVLNNIRRRREQLAYSQEYLALKLQITQKGYSNTECNSSRLTVKRFLDICIVLEVSPLEMLTTAP